MSGRDSTTVPETFEEDADGQADAGVTDRLRERANPDWTDVTARRFARRLDAGELDGEVWDRSRGPDRAFVESLTGAFGCAAGEAPAMEATSRNP